MANNTKRFLSLLLALVMVIGLMPVGHAHAEVVDDGDTIVYVAAETAATEIESGTNYLIWNTRSTEVVRSTLSGNNRLAQDATLTNFDTDAIWTVTAVEGGYYIQTADGKYMTFADNSSGITDEATVVTITTSPNTEGAWQLGCNSNYLNDFNQNEAAGYFQSGDAGSQWKLFEIVQKTLNEIDPYGKRFWTEVEVDTETANGGTKEGDFEKAWDNNPATHWHSNWDGASDKLDQEGETFAGVINFTKEYTINTFSFTPRQDDTGWENGDGVVTMASLYVKDADDTEWKLVREHVEFEHNQNKKTFCFEEQAVQYVKFVAERSVYDGWVAVSEFDIALDEDAHIPMSGPEGYCTDNVICEACGTVIEEGAEAHMPDQDDGNCTTAVYCISCPAVVIPAAEAHTYVDDGDCTTADKCANCDVVATKADAHVFDNDCTTADKCANCDVVATKADAHVFDNDCTTADKCANCEQVATKADAHTYEDEYDADCDVCGTTREVPDKPVETDPVDPEVTIKAQIVNTETVIDLTDCEYTYTEEGKFVHAVSETETIYFTLNGNSGKTPASTASGDTVVVEANADGSVYLQGQGSENRYLHFYSNKTPAGWDRCSGHGSDALNHANGTHAVYLLAATEESAEDALIPGYEVATSLTAGTKYLVVGVHTDGNYYVLHPSVSATATDHIAQLIEVDVPEKPVTYTVNVVVENGGTVTGIPEGPVAEGTEITLIATADEDYDFTGWYNVDDLISEDAEYTFTVTTDVNLTAGFSEKSYVYTVTVTAEGEGTAAITFEGITLDSVTVEECSDVTVTATAAEGYVFAGWYVGEELVSEATEYTFEVTENIALVAKFEEEIPEDTTPVETEPEFEPEYTSEQITGITGEASSEEDDDNGPKPVSYAFDGIKNADSNFWASEPNASGIAGNEHLIAVLGGKYLVNQVAYTRRTAGATAVGNLVDYTIWVSTDGETYEEVATGTMEDAATAVITFDAVEATHVKLTATQSHHWQAGSVNTVMAAAEFEVFKAVCVEHTFDADCKTADTCKYCDAVAETAEHVFDNNCTTDDKCENCEVKAEAAEAHVFDKDCSTADKCANCEQTAEAVPHVFDNDCETADKCANCDVVAEAGQHTFDGDCTTADKCENCDEVATKADAHVFDDDCTTDDKCANCLVLAEKAEAHVFDKDCMTADKCANCEQTATAATEHALDEGVHTDGENGGLGYTTYSCTNEGCEYTTDVDDEYTFSNEQITGITGEASSVDTGEAGIDKSVANAFDGDLSTFWATVEDGTLEEDYLIADLGETVLINKIEYTKRNHETAGYNCTGNLLNYIIEVSTDGETWTKVAEGETVDGTTVITFEPVMAAKVRLTSTSSYHWQEANANKVMTVAEFAVYEAICDYHIPAEDDSDCETALNCTVCGEELVAATEHTPDEDDKNCTTAEVCAVCGTEIVAATEHEMDEGVYTEGEGEELGYTTYSCTNEGCEHTDVVYDEPEIPEETDPAETDPVEIDFNATKVNWTGTAESETIFSNTEGRFTYAWDGQTNTIWHTDWQGANKGILTGENTISAEINFGEAYTINQFSFLPRQDGAAQSWPDGCCLLLQGSLFVKAAEDAEWVCVADQVTFAHTEALKTFYFTEQPVQFVKLVCERASQMGLSDGNGPLGYVAVAEFYIEDDAASDLTITATNDGYGTITGVPEAPVAIGTSVTLTAVPAEGRTFEGWYNSMNTKVSTDAEYTFPAATNISLTAKFVDNTYTVTFDHGYNEQTSTKTVTHGNTVALPTVTREGYTFDGWFDAENIEFTADTAVTGDITVTAKWTEAVVEPTIPEVTDPTVPDASEPDASEPDASEPDASEPDASEPDASEPEESKPVEDKPTVPECDKDDNCVLSQFDDITVTEWYHDGIHFCVEEGIMNGMGEGKFAPTENTTRAQLVMMLYRLAGTPSVEGKTEPFTDVADTDWFYAPIVWAYENKVVNGVSETEFAPNASVTREQVATILFRYLGEPEGTGKLEEFPDVADVSEYAVAPLTWAVGEGLITGIAQADGTALLAPTGNATRAQIATILMRYLTK